MRRHSPRSTLCPYTTLFRSIAILWFGVGDVSAIFLIFLASLLPLTLAAMHAVHNVDPVHLSGSSEARKMRRSEEHTSELQSRQYLVCRLLLEKKKRDLDSAS